MYAHQWFNKGFIFANVLRLLNKFLSNVRHDVIVTEIDMLLLYVLCSHFSTGAESIN
jgi:hypothetical protein